MADECTGDVSVSVKAQELIVTQHINAVGGRIHIRDVGPGVGLVLCSVHQNDFIGENAVGIWRLRMNSRHSDGLAL